MCVWNRETPCSSMVIIFIIDGMTQIAQLRENVKMINRNTTLLTDSLNYDRLYDLGYYFEGEL